MKECSLCFLQKELNNDNFYWRNDSKKWRNECKTCVRNKRKTDHINNREIQNKSFKQYYINNKLKCANRSKKYQKDNVSKIAKKRHEYYTKNKDNIKIKSNDYRLNNKDKMNSYKRNYHIKRYQEDLIYKLRHDVSSSINKTLNRNNGSKMGKSIMNYIGYTFDDFIKHIESQFEPWMNWGNRGHYITKEWRDNDSSTWVWQIDHIVPHASLRYDSMAHPNFKKCWALENLRPLSAKQNVLEGASKVRHKVSQCL
jgi:hypothetical protein